MIGSRRALPVALAALLVGLGGTGAAWADESCVECHSMNDEERLVAPTRTYPQDIHAQRGLGCASCHGGDPADLDVTAMDPDKGFKGKLGRGQIAAMCASCHANAAFMKRFNPRPYIFSMDEFRTSVHYQRAARGDLKAATCIDCHGVHGIRPHTDPTSPVYARNVPATCAKCHNSRVLKGYGIPTNQYSLYVGSVHGRALLEKGDLSAPACNDCHGNHGAAPPGLKEVALVCGTCHGREAELFEGSAMRRGMEAMGKPGCVTCHGNHGVVHPTDAMLSAAPGGKCADCHEPGSSCAQATDRIIARFQALRDTLVLADSLLKLSEVRGMQTGPGRDALREAQDRLVGTRAGLHSFSDSLITGVLAEGLSHAGQAVSRGRETLRDWRNRRVGLALSLVVILITMGWLVATIRRRESSR